MRLRSKILLALAALFLLAQIVPVDRSNPPVTQEVPASPDARAVLRRACYDCHSNETRWPWYAWVAPVSWLVGHDVEEAREHMNFSTWDRYTPDEQAHHLEEIWEEVEDGDMPLPIYVPLHAEAKLSAADKEALRLWATAGADGGEAEEE